MISFVSVLGYTDNLAESGKKGITIAIGWFIILSIIGGIKFIFKKIFKKDNSQGSISDKNEN